MRTAAIKNIQTQISESAVETSNIVTTDLMELLIPNRLPDFYSVFLDFAKHILYILEWVHLLALSFDL